MKDKYGRSRNKPQPKPQPEQKCLWLIIQGDKKKGRAYPYCAFEHDYVINMDVKCGVDCKNFKEVY